MSDSNRKILCILKCLASVDFVKFKMICPSCSKTMHNPEPACPHCGFALDDLRVRFGAVPRYNAYATDTTLEEVTTWELRRMKKHLMYFEKKFSQSRFAFFLTKLLPGVPLSEYTFYLFNRCHFAPMRAKHENNFAILMVVDINTECASLITGYGFEGVLEPETLDAVLRKCSPALAKRKYVKVVEMAVKELSTVIKRKVRNEISQ